MTTVGELVAVGRTSEVYEFGRGSVLKVPGPSVPRHWAAMEAEFTAAVRALGAPAPEVKGVVEFEGRDGIVFERIDGRSLWDLLIERPEEVDEVAASLAELHRSILSTGLPDSLQGLVDRMCRKIDEVAVLSVDERSQARAMLGRLPLGAALLHGDFHPGNVLMAEDGPIVIDWFDATIGHPIADVVRTSFLLRPMPGNEDRPYLPGATQGLLERLHRAYVHSMSDIIAVDVEQLRQWEAVVAASRLAEDIESDEAALLDVWRHRLDDEVSALLAALSADDDRSQ